MLFSALFVTADSVPMGQWRNAGVFGTKAPAAEAAPALEKLITTVTCTVCPGVTATGFGSPAAAPVVVFPSSAKAVNGMGPATEPPFWP
jgi:hypothetical protein